MRWVAQVVEDERNDQGCLMRKQNVITTFLRHIYPFNDRLNDLTLSIFNTQRPMPDS